MWCILAQAGGSTGGDDVGGGGAGGGDTGGVEGASITICFLRVQNTSEKRASVKDSEHSKSHLKPYNYADKENPHVD